MPGKNYTVSMSVDMGTAVPDITKAGTAAKKSGDSFHQQAREAERASSATRKYSSAADKSATSSNTAAKSTNIFTRALRSMTDGILGQLKNLALLLVAWASFHTAIDQFKSIVTVFAEFEQSMAAVQAVTTATTVQMERMTAVSVKLGEDTRFSSAQAASGMEFLGRAGWKTNQIISSMPSVLNLASAAQLDMASSADITSNIMAAFNIQAEEATRIADALAAVAANANTDVTQMGIAMKYVGPVSGALGISMEDTAAAVGTLSNAGIQASMAGTGLRRILSELSSPTKAAKSTIHDLGLTLSELTPRTNSITEIVHRLADANIGAADAFKIFGDRGAPAILALTSQVKDLDRLTAAVNGSEGAADRMAKVMEDTLAGAGRALRSVIESVRITIGEELAPTIRETAQDLRQFFKDNKDNAAEFGKNLATTIASIVKGLVFFAKNLDVVIISVAALATALIALGTGAAQYVVTFTSLAVAEGLVGTVSAALVPIFAKLNAIMAANPAILLAAALAGLVVVIGLVIKANRDAEQAAKELFEKIRYGSDDIKETSKAFEKLREKIDQSYESFKKLKGEVLSAEDRFAKLTPILEQMREALDVGDARSFKEAVAAAEELGVVIGAQTGESAYVRVKDEVEALKASIEENKQSIIDANERIKGSQEDLAANAEEFVKNLIERQRQQRSLMNDYKDDLNEAKKRVDALAASEDARSSGIQAYFAYREVKELTVEANLAAQEYNRTTALLSGSFAHLTEETTRFGDATAFVVAYGTKNINQVLLEMEGAASFVSDRLDQLFNAGNIDAASSLLNTIPDDVFKKIFPDGQTREEVIEFYKKMNADFAAYIKKLDDAAEAEANRIRATAEQKEKFEDLVNSLHAEIAAEKARAIVAVKDKDLRKSSLDLLAAENEAREKGNDLLADMIKQLIPLIEIRNEEARLATGTEIITRLEEQLKAQENLTAQMLLGKDAGEAEIARLELEAVARDDVADAALSQEERIKSLHKQLQDEAAQQASIKTKESIEEEIEALQGVIKAYGQSVAAGQEASKQKDIEAQKTALLASLSKKYREELAPLVEVLFGYRQTVEELTVGGALSQQIHLTELQIRATKEGRLELQALVTAQTVYNELLRTGLTGNAETVEKMIAQAIAAQRLADELSKAEKQAEAVKQVFNNFLSGFQSAFAQTIGDVVRDGIDSFEDFFNSLTDLFINTVAEWAAQLATTKLVASIGVEGFSGAAGLSVTGGKEFADAVKRAVDQLISGGEAASAAIAAGGATGGGNVAAGAGVAATEIGAGGVASGVSMTSGGVLAEGAMTSGGVLAEGAMTKGGVQGGAALEAAAIRAGAALQAGAQTSSVTDITGNAGWLSAIGGTAGLIAIAAPIALIVAAKIYSDNKKKKEFGIGFGAEIRDGELVVDQAAGELQQIADTVGSAVQAIVDAIGEPIESFPKIAIQARNDGKQVRAIVEGEIIGVFSSAEEALGAAAREAARRIEGNISPEIRRALEESTATTVDELLRDIETAIRSRDANLSEATRQLAQDFRNVTRSSYDFRNELRELGLDMSAAADSLADGLTEIRDRILSVDDYEERLEQAEYFNARVQELEAARMRELEEALRQLESIGGLAEGTFSGGSSHNLRPLVDSAEEFADTVIHAVEVSGAGFGAGSEMLRSQIDALLRDIEQINRELNAIPDLITPEEIKKPPRRSGGGGGGNQAAERERDKEALEQLLISTERSTLSDFRRELIETNERWNEATARAIELGIAEERVNAARQIAIDQLAQQVRDPLLDYLGPNAIEGGRFGLSDLDKEALDIRERFDQIREENQALLDETGERAIAFWKINQAELRALRELAENVISGLGLPMEEVVNRVKDLEETLTFLNKQVEDGVLSLDRLGEVIVQLQAKSASELYEIAAGLLEQTGNAKKAQEFRLKLEEARFHFELAQLNFLFIEYKRLGLLTDAVIAGMDEALAFLNNPENWPDFTTIIPPLDDPPPPPPTVTADTSRDTLLQRIEDQIRAWNDLALSPALKQAKDLKRTFDELAEEARKARIPIDRLAAAFRVAVKDFVNKSLEEFERLGTDPLELELRDINEHFRDLRAAFRELGVSAGDWLRLEQAQAAALADFWQRATDPLRQLLSELRDTDPRRTGREAFEASLQEFRSLRARAQAGDLEALQQLEQAGRGLLAQTEQFLGKGVGSLEIRDEIMEALEQITGLDGEEISNPVVSEVRHSNDLLTDIRTLLGGPRPTNRPANDNSAVNSNVVNLAARRAAAQMIADVSNADAARRRTVGSYAAAEAQGSEGRTVIVTAPSGARETDPAVLRLLIDQMQRQERTTANNRDRDMAREREATMAQLSQTQTMIGLLESLLAEEKKLVNRINNSAPPAGRLR